MNNFVAQDCLSVLCVVCLLLDVMPQLLIGVVQG